MKRITFINSWYELKPESTMDEWPSPRSGHACVIYKDSLLYVFGGTTGNETLNDMYEYNIETNVMCICSISYITRLGDEFPHKTTSFLQVTLAKE